MTGKIVPGEVYQSLENKFLEIWDRIGAEGNALRCFHELAMRYGEEHRFHHTFWHIYEGLVWFPALRGRGLLANPDAIEFAWWFHDAIYDPTRDDNELQSAILSYEWVAWAGLSDKFNCLVSSAILATKHSGGYILSDEQYLADIDLSILGQPSERFWEYERDIRTEYSAVPWERFASRRSEILRSFRNRGNIFGTEFFYGLYEMQACKNISQALERLSS